MSNVAAYARPALPVRPKRWKKVLLWSAFALIAMVFASYQALMWTPREPLSEIEGFTVRERIFIGNNAHSGISASGSVVWIYDVNAQLPDVQQKLQKAVSRMGLKRSYSDDEFVSYGDDAGNMIAVSVGRVEAFFGKPGPDKRVSTVYFVYPLEDNTFNDVRVSLLKAEY